MFDTKALATASAEVIKEYLNKNVISRLDAIEKRLAEVEAQPRSRSKKVPSND